MNSTTQAALATLDRVATGGDLSAGGHLSEQRLRQALQAVAGAMNKQIGTKVFWVQTGGYDTHAQQGANAGAYVNLMATLDDGLKAFYDDLSSQGLLNNTVILVYSEFGRRISENGSQGTDHGAGGNMMLLGGLVRGGIYGTAPNLNMDPANPTLENSNGDVRFETDFRAVYAKILDNWLGSNSVAILGADYRAGAPKYSRVVNSSRASLGEVASPSPLADRLGDAAHSIEHDLSRSDSPFRRSARWRRDPGGSSSHSASRPRTSRARASS